MRYQIASLLLFLGAIAPARGGADGIQSYFGITFDMGKLLR